MDENTSLKLLKTILRIRAVEEKIALKYPENKMRCPTHLSIGQEASPTAISACLTNNDFAVSTHRGHAHYLAKGGDLKAMISEIYGKVTGCSRGKGGSMHLIDKDVGFMGTSAIVGNSIPIGVGLALSSQLKREETISVIYLGDGAIEEGVFYESLNFAILRKLRVLFVCENNLYSVYSPLSVRQPNFRKITDMVEAIGSKVESLDGNNLEECFKISKTVIAHMRKNGGPYFLEFHTYRHREHCGPNFDNDLGYRTIEEFTKWKNYDPVENFKLKVLKKNYCTEDYIFSLEKEIEKEILDAFKFAEEAPYPDQSEAFEGVYRSI